ncbi:MAG: hypothetical protein LUO93_03700, partial [Methanomicrobiales archaeon]|nr:hypothetical protein [Methanomicrobiales archaeon]
TDISFTITLSNPSGASYRKSDISIAFQSLPVIPLPDIEEEKKGKLREPASIVRNKSNGGQP